MSNFDKNVEFRYNIAKNSSHIFIAELEAPDRKRVALIIQN